MVVDVDGSGSFEVNGPADPGPGMQHGQFLVTEQGDDGAPQQHHVATDHELTDLLERLWNADPDRSVRVFRLDEIAITRRQEYRVEVTGVRA
ncbi:MAG: hypothetical protein ACK5PP_17900 [Acidimicrobiales bacterium]